MNLPFRCLTRMSLVWMPYTRFPKHIIHPISSSPLAPSTSPKAFQTWEIFDNTSPFLIHLRLMSLCLGTAGANLRSVTPPRSRSVSRSLPTKLAESNFYFRPFLPRLTFKAAATLLLGQVSLSSAALVVGCSDLSGRPDQTGPPGTVEQVGRGTRATNSCGSLLDPCWLESLSLLEGCQPLHLFWHNC